MEKIADKSKFDLPESMIKREMEIIFRRIIERTGIYGKNINEFASALGMDENEFLETIRKEALSNIKTTLVLSEIAKKEELKVSEERYKELIEITAKRNRVEDKHCTF